MIGPPSSASPPPGADPPDSAGPGSGRDLASGPADDDSRESSSAPTRRERILVVDDDSSARALLERLLIEDGYPVEAANTGEGMWEALGSKAFDLVILDLVLPDFSGLDLAVRLRAELDVGIIILTGKADTVDRIIGLELGADDYIGKPFDNRELLARVRSVLRRRRPAPVAKSPAAGSAVVTFDGWHLDTERHDLTDPTGRPVSVTTAEYRLLRAFVDSPNRVLSRDRLLNAIAAREWDPYDRSIDVLVGKLRRKLGDDARAPRLIKTIRGAGYMFVANVTR